MTVKSKVTAGDLGRIRSVSSLNWSNDGKWLYFYISRPDLEHNRYIHTLAAMDETGRENVLAEDTGTRELLVLDNGSLIYPVNNGRDGLGNGYTEFAALSPEGEERGRLRIPVEQAKLQKIDDRYFLVSARCGRRETDGVIVCDELPFCADGRGYICGERKRLFVFDRADGRLVPVTGMDFEAGPAAVLGHKIVYAGSPHSGVRDLSHGLYCYDMDSGSHAVLEEPGSFHIAALAFVDGSLIAAANPWRGYGSKYGHSLYRYDEQSGHLELCADLSREDLGFEIAGDCHYGTGTIFAGAKKLYFLSTAGSACRLCSWNQEQGVQRLTGENFLAEQFAVRDGKCAVYGCEWGGLPEIYLCGNGSGPSACLSSVNRAFTEARSISMPEKFSFCNRQGMELDGFILRPADYEEGKSYPGVLEIHGGPRAAYSFAFNHEMQLLASRGYFVCYCNPRGSAGRGNEFADIRGIRGTVDYEDLMDFMDQVLERYPQIDPGRLAVTGGSYGGYMVNWMIGHTNRFAAAVSCRSNSNILGNYGVSDNAIWSVEGSYGASIWQNAALIWEQSPLKYADRASTPTLFLHSLEDYRCRFPNALQMYTALKTRGVETKMLLFEGECHELSRSGRPLNRVRRLEALAGWIEDHTR